MPSSTTSNNPPPSPGSVKTCFPFFIFLRSFGVKIRGSGFPRPDFKKRVFRSGKRERLALNLYVKTNSVRRLIEYLGPNFEGVARYDETRVERRYHHFLLRHKFAVSRADLRITRDADRLALPCRQIIGKRESNVRFSLRICQKYTLPKGGASKIPALFTSKLPVSAPASLRSRRHFGLMQDVFDV